MTEKKIQSALNTEFIGKRKHKVSIPNVYIFDWESDLLTINRNNYISEYEIKCSKWDYLNDFKKEGKHKELTLMNNLSAIPNYFYYACPMNLIDIKDVPDYAGLIYVRNSSSIWEVKKAPVLHNEKFDKWEECAVKLSYKLV